MLRKIINVGIDKTMPYPLQQRIVLSNIMALVMSIAILFLATSYILFSERNSSNLSIQLITPIICVIIFVLNYFKISQYSRLLLSITPPLSLLVSNISLKITQPEIVGYAHYITPRMVMVSMVAIPLVLFTLKEKVFTLVGIIFTISLAFLAYYPIHNYYNIWYTDLSIQQVSYQVILEDMIITLVILLICLLFYLLVNNRYETRTNQLLHQTKERNNRLNNNEQKLKQTLDILEERRIENKRQNWSSQGLAHFSKLLRKQDNTNQLYKNITSELIQYFGGLQGALYLLLENNENEENNQLEILSTYAYNRERKQKNKFISVKESGLLGQVVKSKKYIYLDSIPSDYSNTQLGVSEISPRYVLVFPFIFQNKVEAIFELLGIEEIEEYQLNFLNQLGENLAAFIANLQNDLNNQRLLKQSQETFKELQKMQQEMLLKEQYYVKKIDRLENELQSKSETK